MIHSIKLAMGAVALGTSLVVSSGMASRDEGLKRAPHPVASEADSSEGTVWELQSQYHDPCNQGCSIENLFLQQLR